MTIYNEEEYKAARSNLLKSRENKNKSMKKFLLITMLSFLAFTTNAMAEEIKPSFDCKKANTEVEKLICSDT
ncbi:MAG: hypothetical protein BWY78_00610 [Alphaproteobacteria bacterium ADurb.Bin438]|nr:MAG: hypothetical protein BWY78_00610 [Alphaproteobacteria bacterium ADurb.Bin438]